MEAIEYPFPYGDWPSPKIVPGDLLLESSLDCLLQIVS